MSQSTRILNSSNCSKLEIRTRRRIETANRSLNLKSKVGSKIRREIEKRVAHKIDESRTKGKERDKKCFNSS